MTNTTINGFAVPVVEQVSDMAMVRLSDLNSLVGIVKGLAEKVNNFSAQVSPAKIYDSNAVKEKLHIKDKLLKQYRDEGFLGYSRIGDKYWYTQEDIDKFLVLCKVEPIYRAA